MSDVSPGGPAAKLGLKQGDVISSVDGKAVRSTGQLRNLIAAAGAGKKVELEMVRGGGKKQTLE